MDSSIPIFTEFMSTKVLFVCPFIPEKNAHQAGHRLAYEYLAKFAETSAVDLVLLIKGSEEIPSALNEIPNVNLVAVERFHKMDMLWNGFLNLWMLPFLTRFSKRALARINGLISEKRYDIINLEFSQTFYYIKDIRKTLGRNAKIYVSAHDVQTQAFLRKTGILSMWSSYVYKLENELINLADKVFVLSSKDRDLVKSLFGEHLDVDLKPLPLLSLISEVNRTIDTIEKGSIMFWGAMNRAENELSVISFLDTLFLPVLLKERPMLKLYIVGANPSARLKQYSSDNVIITGFIENPREYFEKAEIGIVPLLYGAGVKLKTLEMLSTGMNVVSTRIGVEGIDLKEYNNIDVCAMEDFPRALMMLLDGKKIN